MNDEKERIPSQIDRILAVLESGGTLTALDALEGYPVASRMVTRRNRYGRLCRVAEYYMEC